MTRKAVVLIPACSNLVGNHFHPSHTVQRKYSDAVFYGANCTPLFIPAMGAALDIDVLLDVADGIFLTGSPSNVGAALYGEEVQLPHLPQDALRDDLTLPLIKAAIERGIPIFGVCRGLQEMNVALGGTLHQAVHELPEFMWHIAQNAQNSDEQYGFSHMATAVDGGMVQGILHKTELWINSVHGQGINRLAAGLTAEVHAPDGLVEAFRIDAHPTFGLAVQWHPEWKMADNPDSVALFAAFGDACRAYRAVGV